VVGNGPNGFVMIVRIEEAFEIGLRRGSPVQKQKING
jgi:hypothetical protein